MTSNFSFFVFLEFALGGGGLGVIREESSNNII